MRRAGIEEREVEDGTTSAPSRPPLAELLPFINGILPLKRPHTLAAAHDGCVATKETVSGAEGSGVFTRRSLRAPERLHPLRRPARALRHQGLHRSRHDARRARYPRPGGIQRSSCAVSRRCSRRSRAGEFSWTLEDEDVHTAVERG